MLIPTLLIAMAALPLGDDASFMEARALYTTLDYEQAATTLSSLLAVADRAAPERGELHMWLGLCQAGMGQVEEARGSFERAQELWPEAALPADVSPKVVEMFREAALAMQTKRLLEAPAASDGGAASGITATEDMTQAGSTSVAVTSIWTLVGLGSAALGTVAALAGGLVTGGAVASVGDAVDRNQYQDEAQAHLDDARGMLGLATVLFGAGGVLIAGGAGLVAVDLLGIL